VRLLADSSFIIDLLRGDSAAVSRWTAVFELGDEPFVNEVVVCEVRAGLTRKGTEIFGRVLEPVEFVQPSPNAALLAGRWRSELRAAGRTLSLADSLIAAAAVSVGAVVLTRNVRDFDLTPARVETY
jgi:tRNA(fMet)-specific endonuclease VapC